MVPVQVGAAGLVAPLGILVVILVAAYLVFRRVEGDANRARRRTERSSRKAAGGLVTAGLAVLAGLTEIWTAVADGLGEAVAIAGTPAGETVASGVFAAFATYGANVAADLPFTTAFVIGVVVFAVGVGVTRA